MIECLKTLGKIRERSVETWRGFPRVGRMNAAGKIMEKFRYVRCLVVWEGDAWRYALSKYPLSGCVPEE